MNLQTAYLVSASIEYTRTSGYFHTVYNVLYYTFTVQTAHILSKSNNVSSTTSHQSFDHVPQLRSWVPMPPRISQTGAAFTRHMDQRSMTSHRYQAICTGHLVMRPCRRCVVPDSKWRTHTIGIPVRLRFWIDILNLFQCGLTTKMYCCSHVME